LVEGDLVRLLNRHETWINHTLIRRKGCRDGENCEFGLIAHNGGRLLS